MISMEQLDAEIKILEDKEPNYTVMGQLANLYTVRDHMGSPQAGLDSDSGFYKLVAGKDLNAVFLILDDVMETLKVLNPSLFDSIIRKFNELS